jgi:peptidoglycan hydrolase-like protein with peptidoglycan-binding domain
MGAVKRGSRLARIGATAIAAATVAAACTAAAASSASAATSGAKANAAAASKTVSARSATPAAYVPPSGTLSEGSHGAAVKALQQRLAALKYDPGTADGSFGANTEDAVWAFQEINGVKVTGVIDAATKRALVSPKTYHSNDPRQDGNRIEVNQHLEVLVLYKNDKIQLISHVSTGGGYWYNCGGGVKVPLGAMYNPVFFISTVYAIHGDTYVPVFPDSHGCVRLPMFIADFFHTLVKTKGEEVFIYGKAQWMK